MTGLYVESHGILASNMYDPVTKKHFNNANDSDPMWWSKTEPIWLTALDHGYTTGTAMWPGSDVRIRNRTATHYLPYNHRVSFRERLRNVTSWLLGEGEVWPMMMTTATFHLSFTSDVSFAAFPLLLCKNGLSQ